MSVPMRGRVGFSRATAWAAAAMVAVAGAVVASNDARAPGVETYVGVEYGLTAAIDHVFFISGDTSGLYPGATVDLPLTVTNPNVAAIQVNALTVAVTGTDRPACLPTGANLQTTDYTGPPFVVAGGNGTATVHVPLAMPHAVGDECQDTTFDLTYGGTAVNIEGTPGTKTVNVGPYGQGNLQFQPGSLVSIGVNVKLNVPEPFPVTIDVTNAVAMMPIKCSNGSLAATSPFTISLPDQHFSIPLNSNAWYPAENGSQAVGFQYAVQVPAMCAGIGTGVMKNAGNDFLAATITASDTPVFFKWHFAIPVAKGFGNLDCSSLAANPDPGIPACTAGWSDKVDP